MKRKIKTPAPIVPPAVEAVQKPVAAENPNSVEPKESIATAKEGQDLVLVDFFPNELARKAESDLLDAIYQSELSIRRIKAEIDEYVSRVDRLQAEYQQASNARTELLRDLPAQLIAARHNRPIGVVRAEAERLETGGAADDSDEPTEVLIASSDPSVLPGGADSAPEYVDDGAWREFDARAAIEGIDRLGEGRLNAIVAEYLTLGDLADARERAKLEKKPFMNMLPKGTGPKVAAGIESVLEDAVAGKLRAKLSPPAETTATEPQAAESKEIRIARSIYRSISSLTEDELRDGADENWVDGSEAWNAGKTIDDAASLGLEMPALTSWIRGWACTERYAARVGSSASVVEETADGGKVEKAAYEETEYNSAEVYDEKHLKFVRDMLKWFADGRKGEAEKRSASNVNLWELGAEAYSAHEPAEECPVEFEKSNGEWGRMEECDQVDWLRGWYWASANKGYQPEPTPVPAPEPEDEPATEPEPEPATVEPPPAVKPPRTLADVIAEIEAEPSPRKSKANQLAYGKGYSSGIMKGGITTCPYDAELSNEVAKDWVRGYLEGSSISDDDEL